MQKKFRFREFYVLKNIAIQFFLYDHETVHLSQDKEVYMKSSVFTGCTVLDLIDNLF